MAMKILTWQELSLYLRREYDLRTVKNDFLTRHKTRCFAVLRNCAAHRHMESLRKLRVEHRASCIENGTQVPQCNYIFQKRLMKMEKNFSFSHYTSTIGINHFWEPKFRSIEIKFCSQTEFGSVSSWWCNEGSSKNEHLSQFDVNYNNT